MLNASPYWPVRQALRYRIIRSRFVVGSDGIEILSQVLEVVEPVVSHAGCGDSIVSGKHRHLIVFRVAPLSQRVQGAGVGELCFVLSETKRRLTVKVVVKNLQYGLCFEL